MQNVDANILNLDSCDIENESLDKCIIVRNRNCMFFRKVCLLFLVVLWTSFSSKACTPYSALTVNWQVVGTTLQVNLTSNTAWDCCYTARIELVCQSQNFTGNYQYSTNQICKPNTGPMPYNQVNIDISQYCPGTQLKFRAREASGPITSTYSFVVPGANIFDVSPSANPLTVCPGGCTDISANANGGCGGLTYSWTNGSTGPTINVCPAQTTTYQVTVTDPRDACGPQTATGSVTIDMEPPVSVGNATIQSQIICLGEDAVLNLSNTTGNIQWQTSSDGAPPWIDIAGATTASYTYPQPLTTTYFRVTASNSCDSEVSNTVSVQVLPLPPNGFSFNTVCETDATAFEHLSSPGEVATWQWDFGDNNGTSSQQNSAYTYSQFGIYDATLVVTSPEGCTNQLTQQVTVNARPEADFSFIPVCAEDLTIFTDLSGIGVGAVTAWDWDFDGLGTSAIQNPDFVFSAAGSFAVSLTATSDQGCSDISTQLVEAFELPQASFVWVDLCDPEMTLTDQSHVANPGQLSSWQWDFGDNIGTSSQQSPVYTYPQFGTYDVQLNVETLDGCLDSIVETVEVYPAPVFDISVSDVCQESLFTTQNNSSVPGGVLDSTIWSIDNTIYPDVEPEHVFFNHGIQSIDLRLVSDEGCIADTTFQVEIYPKPEADFSTTNICAENVPPINDLSAVALPGQIISDQWILSNGTIYSYNDITSFVFNSYGSESITLATETQHGCLDSITKEFFVHPVPEADFSFSNICENDTVIYTDQSTVATGAMAAWEWQFGNGQQSMEQQPPSQSYPVDSIYAVQLTVTSDSGCVSTYLDSIEVYPVPVAAFTFDSVCYPQPLQFTDLSDPNGTYPITQWLWNFTDGQTSVAQSPQFLPPVYGVYGATLTVTNEPGCKSDTTLGNALSHPLPMADFEANLQHCYLDTLRLTDMSVAVQLSDDSLLAWQYTLGDGAEIPLPDAQYLYSEAGFYDVQLLITTNHGCQDSVTRTVEVFPLPQVGFIAQPQEGCEPLSVQFIDTSSIPPPYTLMGWQWNLGAEGQLPAVQNPMYVYSPDTLGPFEAAVYDISLRVTSGNGCVDSVILPDHITAHPLPEALFSTDPQQVANIIDPVFSMTDLSTANVVGWDWSFGDGGRSVEQNPLHAYSDTGSYTMELIVETAFGCMDTISYTVKVEPNFTFYIPNSFTPNTDGVNEYFFGMGEYISSYQMEIYDRWGELIFQSNDMERKWDGTYRGKQVQQGQYVYKFRVTDWKSQGHEYVGAVYLHR